jgi:hypothetical protein
MAASFSIVQFAKQIGPYGGSPQVAFTNPVSYGNAIVAVFAAYRNGSPYTYPTGVTDSKSNT